MSWINWACFLRCTILVHVLGAGLSGMLFASCTQILVPWFRDGFREAWSSQQSLTFSHVFSSIFQIPLKCALAAASYWGSLLRGICKLIRLNVCPRLQTLLGENDLVRGGFLCFTDILFFDLLRDGSLVAAQMVSSETQDSLLRWSESQAEAFCRQYGEGSHLASIHSRVSWPSYPPPLTRDL